MGCIQRFPQISYCWSAGGKLIIVMRLWVYSYGKGAIQMYHFTIPVACIEVFRSSLHARESGRAPQTAGRTTLRPPCRCPARSADLGKPPPPLHIFPCGGRPPPPTLPWLRTSGCLSATGCRARQLPRRSRAARSWRGRLWTARTDRRPGSSARSSPPCCRCTRASCPPGRPGSAVGPGPGSAYCNPGWSWNSRPWWFPHNQTLLPQSLPLCRKPSAVSICWH